MMESLIRTRFVVEAHELHDEIAEVVLAEDEDVIEQLTSERADEPFGDRIHVGRPRCRPHDPDADACEGGRERAAELPVKYYVERKVRRFAAKKSNRRGFGWKRWSSEIVYGSWGLFRDYRLSHLIAKARPS